jgi:D-alanyl-D-alanine carboxypeptidase
MSAPVTAPPTRAGRPPPAPASPHRKARTWPWLGGGLALAFAVPFLLTDVLAIQRDIYYGIYAAAVLAFLALWLRRAVEDPRALLVRRWRAGLALGLLVAAAEVAIVLGEPGTSHPSGVGFWAAILWRGVVYGATDGLLLSVFPILAVFGAFAAVRPLRERARAAVVGIGVLALATSVVFTAVYHLGYPDFRGSKLRKPVAGDLVWSAPTLLTLSPLGAPIAHVGLHVAAVVHAYDGDTFLPPHPATARPEALASPARQRILERLVGDPRIAPGATAAVVTPSGTWQGAAGIANLATSEAASPADHFRLASLTKTYTAAIALQLVGDGRLHLSDTVQRWLPGLLPADKRDITVRQLLTHSSGLNDTINTAVAGLQSDRAAFLRSVNDPKLRARIIAVSRAFARDPAVVFPARYWVDLAAALPLDFPPGKGNAYSSTGYVVLGWIAERAGSAPLGRLMQQRIFMPLGLHDTVYDPTPDLPAPFAHGYVLPGNALPGHAPVNAPLDISRVTFGTAGASAVVATARDAARFYAALLSGHVISRRLLDDVMLPEHMGLGMTFTTCGNVYGHTGALFGYASYAAVTPSGDRAAVLLLNGRGAHADDAAGPALGDLLCAKP